jgi:hypothetical protein
MTAPTAADGVTEEGDRTPTRSVSEIIDWLTGDECMSSTTPSWPPNSDVVSEQPDCRSTTSDSICGHSIRDLRSHD